MRRPRLLALAGLAAALLCNYWVLEALLADRHDLEASWISDLATRSQSSGWRFVVLGVIAGIAIAAFAALLLAAAARAHRVEQAAGQADAPAARSEAGEAGEQAPSPGPDRLSSRRPLRGSPIALDRLSSRRLLRGGLIALLASGLFVVLASAAPLDCAEGLEPTCSLAYDPLDVIHATATGGEILATILAFALIGVGLLHRPRRLSPRGLQEVQAMGALGSAGGVTLALGGLWLLATALTGVAYLSESVDSIKGLLQRADQIIFGLWLLLLGLWARDW